MMIDADIRPLSPLTLEDAKRIVQRFVNDYNTVRLHSAIGYVTPQAMLDGRQKEILAERDRKIEQARLRRAEARKAKRSNDPLTNTKNTSYTKSIDAEDRALLGSNSSAASMPLTTVGCELSEITSNVSFQLTSSICC